MAPHTVATRRATVVAVGALLAGCTTGATNTTRTPSCPDASNASRSTCYDESAPDATAYLEPSPTETGQPSSECVPSVSFTLHGNGETTAFAREFVLHEHRDGDWQVVRDERGGERGNRVEPGHQWVLPIALSHPSGPREDATALSPLDGSGDYAFTVLARQKGERVACSARFRVRDESVDC